MIDTEHFLDSAKDILLEIRESVILQEIYSDWKIIAAVLLATTILIYMFMFFGWMSFSQWYIFGHKRLLPFMMNYGHDVRNPSKYGILNAQNVYVGGQEGKIGAWYIRSQTTEKASVLFLHGDSVNRANKTNIGIVKKLVSFGCNVLLIDYRGFGDSDGRPTSSGVIDDSVRCFKWLSDAEKSKSVPHIIYGKKLGAAIGVEAAKTLSRDKIPISCLIIDGGFDSLKNLYKDKWSYKILSSLPFMRTFIEEVENSFDSSKWITKVKCDILFLHVCGDRNSPSYYSHRLFEQYVDANKYCRSKFVMIEKGYNPNNIHESPRFESAVLDFINNSKPVFPAYHFFNSIRIAVMKVSRGLNNLAEGVFRLFAMNMTISMTDVGASFVSSLESFIEDNSGFENIFTLIKRKLTQTDWASLGKSVGDVVGKLTDVFLNSENILNMDSSDAKESIVERLKELLESFTQNP